MRRGFSIIEVLFAVAFLVMVGLAMISLNAAAVRLINNAELQTAANSLNEEAVAVVAIAKKTDPTAFAVALINYDCANGCYVECPTELIATSCSLTNTPAPVQLGRNKLQFVRTVRITDAGSGSHQVQATTSWGAGERRQTTTVQTIR